ncbi:Stc1 domain-containing protein [Cercophora scortea]|uniref:Stc1 domain-containing protein n=1 Tax=Cercophora scortea TaxID=314031 RepID=A0AAE0M7Q2_9PEZI|nr:Stc1 domain-containing protein [Cercophora scortea]
MRTNSKWSSGARGYGAQIRCEIGREWKTRDQFSNGKLKNYDTGVRLKEATPEKSGISCKEHAPGAPAQTIQCEGPCNERRDIKYFSKNTRRKGVYWCSRCVEYQLTSEPGQYLPPPGAALSPDEMQAERPEAGKLRDEMLVEWDDGFNESAVSPFDRVLSASSSGTSPAVIAKPPTANQTNGNTSGSIPQHDGAASPHVWDDPVDNTVTTATSEVSDWQWETSTEQSGATTGSVEHDWSTTTADGERGGVSDTTWWDSNDMKSHTAKWSITTADGERGDVSDTNWWDSNDMESQTTTSRCVETGRSGWVKVRPEKETQYPEYLRNEKYFGSPGRVQ